MDKEKEQLQFIGTVVNFIYVTVNLIYFYLPFKHEVLLFTDYCLKTHTYPHIFLIFL